MENKKTLDLAIEHLKNAVELAGMLSYSMQELFGKNQEQVIECSKKYLEALKFLEENSDFTPPWKSKGG